MAERFGLWPSKTYQRPRALATRGLVVHKSVFDGRAGVSRAPGRRVRPARYAHALAVTARVVERELADERVLPDREVRRAGEAWTVGRDGYLHTPDLAVPRAGDRLRDRAHVEGLEDARAHPRRLRGKPDLRARRLPGRRPAPRRAH